MPRILKNKFRLVVSGITAGPDDLYSEYRIIDGDLSEQPKRVQQKNVNFESTIEKLWVNSIKSAKSKESL